MNSYFGFVYLWTNTHPEAKTHTKYIGQHVGTIDDDYTGSGVLFFRKFKCKKYRGYWKRTILEYCNNLNELNNAEIKWINKYNAVLSEDFCNLKYGGRNGTHGEEARRKISKSHKNNPEFKKMRSRVQKEYMSNLTAEEKKRRSEKLSQSMTKAHADGRFKSSSKALKQWHANMSIERKKQISDKISKTKNPEIFKFLNVKTNEVFIESIRDFSIMFNIARSTVDLIAKGKYPSKDNIYKKTWKVIK
jgi:hypothetical protein